MDHWPFAFFKMSVWPAKVRENAYDHAKRVPVWLQQDRRLADVRILSGLPDKQILSTFFLTASIPFVVLSMTSNAKPIYIQRQIVSDQTLNSASYHPWMSCLSSYSITRGLLLAMDDVRPYNVRSWVRRRERKEGDELSAQGWKKVKREMHD